MQYEVGDQVRVRSIDWIKANCLENHIGYYIDDPNSAYFIPSMSRYCDKVVTITGTITGTIFDDQFYTIENSDYSWNDYMFEPIDNEPSTYEYW